LLTLDPKKRPSASDALNLKWLTHVKESAVDEGAASNVLSNLKGFRANQILK
jgi:hypothetical protein